MFCHILVTQKVAESKAQKGSYLLGSKLQIARNYFVDSPEKCFSPVRKVMFADGEHKFAVREHKFADGEHKFAAQEHKIDGE